MAAAFDLGLIAGGGSVEFIYRFLLHRKDKLSLCLQACYKFSPLTRLILIGSGEKEVRLL